MLDGEEIKKTSPPDDSDQSEEYFNLGFNEESYLGKSSGSGWYAMILSTKS